MECAAYLTGFYRTFKDDVSTIVLMLISLFPFRNQELGLAISAPTQCDQIIEIEQNVVLYTRCQSIVVQDDVK